MLAKDLISDIVPVVSNSDTGIRALNWMDIFRISHLPIINDDEFVGLISDTDIYDNNIANEPISAHKLSLFRPFVYEDQHIYDVILLIDTLKLSIVPVLDREKKYQGVITLRELVAYFGEMASVRTPGAIIVLEMSIHDYSLTEIANIVEGNNVKILSSYVRNSKESVKLDVILKLNTQSLNSVLQTFERYNYTIKEFYIDKDNLDNFYEERYDLFLKYLNV